MRLHPWIHAMVKWSASVIGVLLVGVWVWSQFGSVYWDFPDWGTVSIREGTVSRQYPHVIENGTDVLVFGWERGSHEVPTQWWPLRRTGWSYVTDFVPLWMPTALAGVPAIWAWRLDLIARRREKIGGCAGCGYCLAGLSGCGRCPECGQEFCV